MKVLTPINIAKSVLRHKLIYKTISSQILDYFVAYLITIFWLGLVYLCLFKSTLNIPLFLAIAVYTLLVSWIAANLIFTNKLVLIRGRASGKKRLLRSTLNVHYPRLQSIFDQGHVVKFYQVPKSIGMIYLITCIYDKDIVYLNITALGKGDAMIPFFNFYNYIKAKRIAEELSA